MKDVKRDSTAKTGRFERSALWIAVILLAGLLLRAVFLVQLSRSPMWDVHPLDMRFYRGLAERISTTGLIPDGPLSFNPLYPFFLAAVLRVSGGSTTAARIMQSLIGIATIYLSYIAARMLAGGGVRKSGKAAGLIAAGLAALYPHFLLYESGFLGTSLVVFLFMTAFTLALTIERRISSIAALGSASGSVWLPLFVLGLTVGAGGLGRPNLFFLLIPAVALWLLFRASARRAGAIYLIVFLAGVLLPLTPPVIHNARHTGRFVPVTTHGGVNFYIGNGPYAKGVYSLPEGLRGDMRGLIEDSRKIAERDEGRRLTDAEVSDYWFDKATTYIGADPARWLRLVWRKLYLFWNGVEVADILVIDFYSDSCPVIRFLFVPFTVISPLAVIGLVLLLRSRKNRSITLIFVAAAVFSVLLFYVNSRYRQPAVPLLMCLSALFISWFFSETMARRWKWPIVSVIVFAVLLGGVSARKPVLVNKGAGYNFLGNHYVAQGDFERAEEMFSKSYHLEPGRISSQLNYARILQKRGKLEESAKIYSIAYANDPDFPTLANTYGGLLEELGRRDEAKVLYLHAYSLRDSSDRVLACKLLSRHAYADGDRAGAIEWIERALEIVPGDDSLIRLLHRLQERR